MSSWLRTWFVWFSLDSGAAGRSNPTSTTSFAYVPVNSKAAPPPPRANPGAFDFFEKFWSNSPLCCQFRQSNAPPVRASKRVNYSPPSRENRIAYLWKWAESLTFGNKFRKIFSHYEFLVQLVFAPHFKQRHIPGYNYIKRQQQKNPRGIDKNNDPCTRLTSSI